MFTQENLLNLPSNRRSCDPSREAAPSFPSTSPAPPWEDESSRKARPPLPSCLCGGMQGRTRQGKDSSPGFLSPLESKWPASCIWETRSRFPCSLGAQCPCWNSAAGSVIAKRRKNSRVVEHNMACPPSETLFCKKQCDHMHDSETQRTRKKPLTEGHIRFHLYKLSTIGR